MISLTQNSSVKTFSRIGFSLVAATVFSTLLSIVILLPLSSPENMAKAFELLGSAMLLLTYIPQFGFLLVYWLFVRGLSKYDCLQREGLKAGELIQIFLIMYSVSIFFNILGSVFTQNVSGSNDALENISLLVSTGLPVAIMIPVILGPVVEELIFRKLTIDRTIGYGEKTAIIFSALMFGLFHGNLTQFLFATSVGIFLGYVYCKTGKILLTMILHILINSIGSLLMLLSSSIVSGDSSSSKILIILVCMLFIGMVIAGIVMLIRWLKMKAFRFNESVPMLIPNDEIFKTVYFAPGVALYTLLQIVTIVMLLLHIELPISSSGNSMFI